MWTLGGLLVFLAFVSLVDSAHTAAVFLSGVAGALTSLGVVYALTSSSYRGTRRAGLLFGVWVVMCVGGCLFSGFVPAIGRLLDTTTISGGLVYGLVFGFGLSSLIRWAVPRGRDV